MPSPIVAVLTFDHFSPFHCAVPCLIFGDILPGQPLFELRLCCGDASIHSHSTQGFTIQAPYGLEGLTEADIIVIPFWHDPAVRPPVALLDALIAAIPADIAFAPSAQRRIFGSAQPAFASAAARRLACLVLRPGVLTVSAWDAELAWPLASVDLALRRAGWDQDPGWLPWLGRSLRWRFGDAS